MNLCLHKATKQLDKTKYAQSLGYIGEKPVFVLNGKVISHRSVDWFYFCDKLRKNKFRKK